MEREFLESLGLEPEVLEQIWQRSQQARLDFESQLRQQQVDHAVRQAVTGAGGRNLTAIRALLDEHAIADAQDVSAAAKQAVGRLRREHGYLFQIPQPVAPGTGSARVTDYSMEELGNLSMAEYRAARKQK